MGTVAREGKTLVESAGGGGTGADVNITGPLGSQPAATSLSITLASDQPAIPVAPGAETLTATASLDHATRFVNGLTVGTSINVAGKASVLIVITEFDGGTPRGDIVLECSPDNETTWVSLQALPVNAFGQLEAVGNTILYKAQVNGLTHVRASLLYGGGGACGTFSVIFVPNSVYVDPGTQIAAFYQLSSGVYVVPYATDTDPSGSDIGIVVRNIPAAGFPQEIKQDATGTIAKEVGGNLEVAAGELVEIAGNTADFTSVGHGGYIRQDSNATIAKETGGNLDSIVINTGILSSVDSRLASIKAKTDNLDTPLSGGGVRVIIQTINASMPADVKPADGNMGFLDGQTAKVLTQTPDGRLRVLAGGYVSDTPQNYTDGDTKTLSLTNDGRLRVSSMDALVDKVWRNTFESPWQPDEIEFAPEVSYV